jgi:Carboxypeptidase regulatory-like domain/TonB dependent receptor/TonB-dependent Receptor Plug Domain
MKHLITFILTWLVSYSLYAQTQTITGSVFDDATKAPLAGAVISVINSNPPVGTVTDADGNFKITGIPIGRQSFRVAMLGYEEKRIPDVIVTAGKEVVLNLGLQEALKTLSEVNVVYNKSKDKTHTNNELALVSARSFDVENTKLYAGSFGDPSRMAANFAGVSAGNDSRNDIVVRGNSPNGMLWQLDGLNIPNPNHFGTINSTGGPVSMLNNNNLAKSDFLTSAFPAQYGNALAGVFDLSLRDGNKDRNEFVGQVGFNGFELGAEGPLGKKKQISYIVNYRYSTLSVFNALGLNFGTGTAIPIYQDINYKVTAKVGKKGTLSLFGIAGNSHIDFLGNDVDTTKTNLYGGNPYNNARTKFAASTTGLSYQLRLSDKTVTKFTVGYCNTYQKYLQDSISYLDRTIVLPSAEAKFTTDKISGVWSLTHKFSAKDNLQVGIVYDHTKFDLFYQETHDGTKQFTFVNQNGYYGLLQSYAQWKHRFSNVLTLTGGLHYQYLTLNGTNAIEPRVNFRYAVAKNQSVSIGYGLHQQAQNVYTYYIQTPTANGITYTNKNLDFTRSQHVVLGYDWNITEHLRVKAEGYYQSIDRVPIEKYPSSFSSLNTGSDFSLTNVDSLVNKGTGTNYGVELTVERFLDKGYYFLLTTSLFNSVYKGSDNVERNTAFNTKYVFNILGGKEFKVGKSRTFGVGLKLSTVGGRYFTPIDFAASQAAGYEIDLNNLAYSQKQSDYFRCDVKLSYRKEFKKSTMEFSIDLQNVSANKNIFSQSYDHLKNKITYEYQQGFFPVPTFRYTF